MRRPSLVPLLFLLTACSKLAPGSEATSSLAVLPSPKECVSPPNVPAGLRPWSIAYTQTSGWTGGLLVDVALDSTGQATGGIAGAARDRRKQTFLVDSCRLATVAGIVAKMKEAGLLVQVPPWPDPCAKIMDCGSTTLTVTYDGKVYPIDPSRLHPAFDPLTSVLQSISSDVHEAVATTAWQRRQPLKLGRVWKVTKEVRRADGMLQAIVEGTWTRRGDSKEFDAVWQTKPPTTDVIAIESITRRPGTASATVILVGRESHERFEGGLDVEEGYARVQLTGGRLSGGTLPDPNSSHWLGWIECNSSAECGGGTQCCNVRGVTNCAMPALCARQ